MITGPPDHRGQAGSARRGSPTATLRRHPVGQPRNAAAAMSNTDCRTLAAACGCHPASCTTSARSCHWPGGFVHGHPASRPAGVAGVLRETPAVAHNLLEPEPGRRATGHRHGRPGRRTANGRWRSAVIAGRGDPGRLSGIFVATPADRFSGSATAKPDDDTPRHQQVRPRSASPPRLGACQGPHERTIVDMQLTHFGHSCVLADFGHTTVLFDPGKISHTASRASPAYPRIVITHQHPDHVDLERLPALLDGKSGRPRSTPTRQDHRAA